MPVQASAAPPRSNANRIVGPHTPRPPDPRPMGPASAHGERDRRPTSRRSQRPSPFGCSGVPYGPNINTLLAATALSGGTAESLLPEGDRKFRKVGNNTANGGVRDKHGDRSLPVRGPSIDGYTPA